MGKKSKKDKKHRKHEREREHEPESAKSREPSPEVLIGVTIPQGHVFHDISGQEIERLKRKAARKCDSEAEDYDEALEKKKQRQ